MTAGDRPPGLRVLLHGRHVADLEETAPAAVQLSYTPQHLDDPRRVPLSLSLPPEAQPPDPAQAFRWIDGLLPGLSRVRTHWAGIFGAATPDPFDLLATSVGHDCAGAVQFCVEISDLADRPSGVQPLTGAEFEQIVAEVVEQPAMWGASPGPGGFSLAGVYPKTCLVRGSSGDWGRPYGAAASTHIVKPSPADVPQQAVSEFLSMRAALHAGVQAAPVELEIVADWPTLVVRRFDRAVNEIGDPVRLHQEDAHQACGGTRAIYQNAGGLSPGEIGALLRRHSIDPVGDGREFLRQLVWRWAVADTDGHAKNCAVLLHSGGGVKLAPLYDTWSVPTTYPAISREMTMAMWVGADGSLSAAERGGYWQAVAVELGLPGPTGTQIAAAVTGALADAAAAAVAALPDHAAVEPAADRFLALAEERAAASRPSAGSSRYPVNRYTVDRAGPRAPLPEPRPRCGADMPNARARCILPDDHRGPHRSRR